MGSIHSPPIGSYKLFFPYASGMEALWETTHLQTTHLGLTTSSLLYRVLAGPELVYHIPKKGLYLSSYPNKEEEGKGPNLGPILETLDLSP